MNLLKAKIEDIEEVEIPDGPIVNPNERDLQISVQSLEQVSIRLGNMLYIKNQLFENKPFYMSVLQSEENFRAFIKEIDSNKQVVINKIAIQFWELVMYSLFFKYLYYDYNMTTSPHNIRQIKTDILKVFQLADEFLPKEDSKEVIKDIMKFAINGKFIPNY